jgi:nitrate reductase (NAD(P)H)
VNSAIFRPDHDETVSLHDSNSLNASVDDTSRSYRLSGYAYAGGGRRINRVEISLDDGKIWKLAEMYVHSLPGSPSP